MSNEVRSKASGETAVCDILLGREVLMLVEHDAVGVGQSLC